VSEAGFRAAVVTVSDRSARGEREDVSGPHLAEVVRASGGEVHSVTIVPDEIPAIEDELKRLADVERIPLILTTGGTGLAPRDVTPEATRNVLEREAPGLAEYARASTVPKTKFAILSRGIAGVRGGSLIINLPGSPKAVAETYAELSPVLPHALAILTGATQEHPKS
jgi:molybdenum cofactor synthesis domain-containing protein